MLGVFGGLWVFLEMVVQSWRGIDIMYVVLICLEPQFRCATIYETSHWGSGVDVQHCSALERWKEPAYAKTGSEAVVGWYEMMWERHLQWLQTLIERLNQIPYCPSIVMFATVCLHLSHVEGKEGMYAEVIYIYIQDYRILQVYHALHMTWIWKCQHQVCNPRW